jgi:hypothetical protein
LAFAPGWVGAFCLEGWIGAGLVPGLACWWISVCKEEMTRIRQTSEMIFFIL